MSQLTWRHRSRLTVDGARGWFPVERIDVARVGGGAVVSVEAWPSVEEDLDKTADAHVAGLIARVSGGHVESNVDGADGPDTRRRACGWTESDDTRVRADLMYRRVPGGVSVVMTVLRTEDEAVRAEALAVAESARVVRPWAPLSAEGALEVAPDSTAGWDKIRADWLADRCRAPAAGTPLRVTAEEAMVAARRAGAATFPGVSRNFQASLGSDVSIVLSIAQRCLDARAAEDEELRRRLSVAVHHDLLATVDSLESGQRVTSWIAARADAAVEITLGSVGGQLLVSAIDPGAIAARLLEGVPANAAAAEWLEMSVDDLVSLTRRESAAAILRRVRTVRRTDAGSAAVSGGELRWLVDEAGAVMRIDVATRPGDASVALEPTSRQQLLAALARMVPGSEPDTREQHLS
jgi:hypothetical protein